MNPPSSSPPRLLERFVAYQLALSSLRAVAMASRGWRGWSHLADQARRAASSVALNLAEGNAHPPGSAERRRFQSIARGSALEVEAALEQSAVLELGSAEDLEVARVAAARVAQVLAVMCRR